MGVRIQMEKWAGSLIARAGLMRREPHSLAPAERDRLDWRRLAISPSLGAIDDIFRDRLAKEWTRVARAKHEAIGTWARFIARLQTMGAPFELLCQATQAVQAATEHSEVCFAIASAYSKTPVGPRPLSVQRCPSEMTVEEVFLLAFNEGCVSETITALEAAEAAERAVDPVIRAAWQRIARDGERHAALAWRFVKWGVSRNSTLAARLSEEFDTTLAALSDRALDVEAIEGRLLQAGILTRSLRRQLRAEALTRVIESCLTALLYPDSLIPFTSPQVVTA